MLNETTNPIIARKEVTQHILKRFNIRASKRLGQNFLIDSQVVEDIANTAVEEDGERILEVGPGIGTLTQGLLQVGGNVTAVELDTRLIKVLEETMEGYENLRIIHGDILKVDVMALMGPEPFTVAANLPYYITTPILMHFLESRMPIKKMITMVQKEVALRMVAKPGGKDYGSLSVAIQYWTEPAIVRHVPASSFIPAPEVESAVVCCTVREKPPVEAEPKMFFRVVKASFAQRRKTIFNSLQSGGFSKEEVRDALAKAGIDGQRRGETLSLQEFSDLAMIFSAM